MAAKAILVFASVLFIKTISGQCIGAINSFAGSALAAEELALAGNRLAYGAGLSAYPGDIASYGLVGNSFVPSSGGGFAITSSSPISPYGISVVSENTIEGALAVDGELPFLGAVALDGVLPTAGAGGINYGCGNGDVGIVSENIASAVSPGYGPMGPATATASGRYGYGPGLAGAALTGFGTSGLAAGLSAPSLGYNGFGSSCAYGGVY